MLQSMKHGCVFGFGCGCGTRQFLKQLGAGAAIKKLLKIFLFIFSIKIFLKNTLLCPNLQNKERKRQETQNKKITKKK